MNRHSRLRSLIDRIRAPGAWSSDTRLSDLAVDIYLELLEGPIKTLELDSRFGREPVRVARQQLSRWKLVFEHSSPDGRKLYALPPSQAWTARAADFIWTAQVTPDLLHELGPTGRPAVDEAHKLCVEIAKLAEASVRSTAEISVDRPSALRSGEQIAVALSQLVRQAESEITAMSRGPRLPHLAIIWEAFETRLLGNEFKYTRLVTSDEIIEHGLAIVRRDIMRTNVRLFVGPKSVISDTFYIVDKRLMLVHESVDRGSIITSRRHINGFAQKLSAALGKSCGALSIVRQLQDRAEVLRVKASELLGADGAQVLDRKITNGKFALSPDGWELEKYRRVGQQLAELELLRVTPAGHLLPNYGDVVVLKDDESGDAERCCTTCWCAPSMCYC